MPGDKRSANIYPGQVTAWLGQAVEAAASDPRLGLDGCGLPGPNGRRVTSWRATAEAVDVELDDGTAWRIEVQQTRIIA